LGKKIVFLGNRHPGPEKAVCQASVGRIPASGGDRAIRGSAALRPRLRRGCFAPLLSLARANIRIPADVRLQTQPASLPAASLPFLDAKEFTTKAKKAHEDRKQKRISIPSCSLVRLCGFTFLPRSFLSTDYADFYHEGEEGARRPETEAHIHSFMFLASRSAPLWFTFLPPVLSLSR
jgi:hypothetical protein